MDNRHKQLIGYEFDLEHKIGFACVEFKFRKDHLDRGVYQVLVIAALTLKSEKGFG